VSLNLFIKEAKVIFWTLYHILRGVWISHKNEKYTLSFRYYLSSSNRKAHVSEYSVYFLCFRPRL